MVSGRIAALPIWRDMNAVSKTPIAIQENIQDEVVEAVRRIAAETQHDYVNTWLPDLVEKDKRPVVDKEHETLVDSILSYRDHCIKVNAPIPPEFEKQVEAMRREFASAMLQAKIYGDRSESAKQIFRGAAVASGVGFVLAMAAPNFMHWGTASADDIGNQAAIVREARSEGHSFKEIAAGQIPAVLALLLAAPALTLGIYQAIKSGGANLELLGAQYGAAASLVSLSALGGPAAAMSRRYAQLVREGKEDAPEGKKWKKTRVYLKGIKEALKQRWKSPSAPGLVIGAAAAITTGALLGPVQLPGTSGVLLQNPFFLAAVGTLETTGAVLSTTLYHKFSEWKVVHALKKLSKARTKPAA